LRRQEDRTVTARPITLGLFALFALGPLSTGCVVVTRAPAPVQPVREVRVVRPGYAPAPIPDGRRGYAPAPACQPPPERLVTITSEVRSVPLLGAGVAAIAASPAVAMAFYAPVRAASPNTSAGTIAGLVGLGVTLGGGIVMTIYGGHRVRTVQEGDVSLRIGPGTAGLGGSF
jgi:hypothetical protein